jgi:hypothetical protein
MAALALAPRGASPWGLVRRSMSENDRMADQPAEQTDETREPLLRVVKGEPTAEELAAVVSAVSAKLAAAGATGGRPGTSDATGEHGWAAYWRRLRQPARPGPGAWRASGLPG